MAQAFSNLERAPKIGSVWRHSKRNLLGARVSLTPAEGEGYWELTRIRDACYVVAVNCAYGDPRSEVVPGEGLIQFNFQLSGDTTLAVNGDQGIRFNRPSLLMWAQPAGVVVRECLAASAHQRMVAISVRPEFLLEDLVTSIVEAPPQLQSFVSKARRGLAYCQHALTAQMFDVAMKLIGSPFTGPMALVYTEALALELLCTALNSFCSSCTAPSEECTERELRCVQAAHGVLMRQFAPAPRIRELARVVGMAESALTKRFKAVYGETIFEFSLRRRMQQALTLLRDQHWSVAHVSDAVGYSHSTSFATAFRRHFGMRPIELRRPRSRPIRSSAPCTGEGWGSSSGGDGSPRLSREREI